MISTVIRTSYRFLFFILESLEKTTDHRGHVLVAMGLGLGVGLGVVAARYPMQTYAQPFVYSQQRLQIERVAIPALGVDTVVTSGEAQFLPGFLLEQPAIHITTSASIGQGGPIIIQGINRDYSLQHLQQARLGDEVFVLASNGGWYRYTIIETRYTATDQLSALGERPTEVLVLYSLNFMERQATVVIAAPRR